MFVSERRVKSGAATRNVSLSLAEELQAALSIESHSLHHHHHQQQQQQKQLPGGFMDLGGHGVIGCSGGIGGGIAQFLVDVAELGSPDQVDPVNKFHGVVCDLAYGCVVMTTPDVNLPQQPHHSEDSSSASASFTKSCCDAEQLMLEPTSSSGEDHVTDDVSSSDSSTLLSRDGGSSDVMVTSSCAASVSGASDAGCDSTTAVARDEAEGKKLLLNHFDRTTSLDSSRKSCLSVAYSSTSLSLFTRTLCSLTTFNLK